MKTLDQKLNILRQKIDGGDKVTIAIFGLGSVGCYLLDYLVSLADAQLRLLVVGRNKEKMEQDVNIIRTAACIRRQLLSEIVIVSDCDFTDVRSIEKVLSEHRPDFIVNSSRLYAGLKYGSISWSNLRAYGIWTPLSVMLGKNIMEAYRNSGCDAISINTSYSDAVIPWLKSAGMDWFDFGSGNLNHLIPRMKFYVQQKYDIANPNDIDITLAASHFHDVVISKEGHDEGVALPLKVRVCGHEQVVDRREMLAACRIAMPTDQKRNMMNASSNFDIICAILSAIRNKSKVKIHTPGVDGHIGGYPFIIDGTADACRGYFCNDFTMDEMTEANRRSIYLDGIGNVAEGCIVYTDELLAKVKDRFDVDIPKTVPLDEAHRVAQLLIHDIICPALGRH